MKIKKRPVTLIEMMIVMFLIALIAGAVAYNYRGSLDQGKVFKTRADIEKITTILNLRAAENPGSIDNISSHWQEMIRSSPIVQNPNALIKDGWGQEYQVGIEENVIKVRSSKLEEYERAHTGNSGG